MNNFLFLKPLVSVGQLVLCQLGNKILCVCIHVGGGIGLYISENESTSWSCVLHR